MLLTATMNQACGDDKLLSANRKSDRQWVRESKQTSQWECVLIGLGSQLKKMEQQKCKLASERFYFKYRYTLCTIWQYRSHDCHMT